MSGESIEILKQQVFAVQDLDEEAWQALSALWTEVCFKRRQIITPGGSTERYLYFVLEGVQRACVMHGKRDATLVFSYPHSFSGIIDSFFLQQPSRFFLETITASRLMRIHYNDLVFLIHKFRTVESWVRVALVQTLAGTLQRQAELLSFSAEEKFKALLQRSPHVLQFIPHKYLASYIGVDPATFSKMLGSVRL